MDTLLTIAIILLAPLPVAARYHHMGGGGYVYVIGAFLLAWALIL